MTSIASENNNENMMNKNKFNELIFPVWVKIISLMRLLYSIILYNIYNKKIYNLLLNFQMMIIWILKITLETG